MNNIFKRSFTLFELIVVIIIISIIYYLAIVNFNVKKNTIDMLTLSNLKTTLLKYNFDEEIGIKCIDNENTDCYIFIDGKMQNKNKINLFKKCPTVYEYSPKQIIMEFDDIELKYFETARVCFEFKIKANRQSSQMIVDTDDNVYIYDNISNTPHKIKYINDISIYFDNKIREVKDAF